MDLEDNKERKAREKREAKEAKQKAKKEKENAKKEIEKVKKEKTSVKSNKEDKHVESHSTESLDINLKKSKSGSGVDARKVIKTLLIVFNSIIVFLSTALSIFFFVETKMNAGEDGEKGSQGASGQTVYELFKKYHTNYLGDESLFIKDYENNNLNDDIVISIDYGSISNTDNYDKSVTIKYREGVNISIPSASNTYTIYYLDGVTKINLTYEKVNDTKIFVKPNSLDRELGFVENKTIYVEE